MASGCPVINTSIPGSGVPWVSQDNVSGWTVPPQDSMAIAEGSNRMLNDDMTHQRIVAGARERAKSLFAIETMVQLTNTVYESALSLSRSRAAATNQEYQFSATTTAR